MTLRIWIWAGVLAAFRVGSLWLLVYREWTHQQSIATLPLIFVMYPEGLLLRAAPVWTTQFALVFSAMLLGGSLVWSTCSPSPGDGFARPRFPQCRGEVNLKR
ncbi:MAG TPA: hypothetical protein VKW09_02980 [bacterium]|nr:hypothetical protein [bacterium]